MNFALQDEDNEQGKQRQRYVSSHPYQLLTADIKLDLTKKSRRIGRNVEFSDQRGVVLEELRPDSELAAQYIVSRASTRATQFSAYSYISHVTSDSFS